MRAAVLRQFAAPFQVEDVPEPVPGDGEVLIEVQATGLCSSDLHIRDGHIPTVTLPHIPGHEIAGRVAGPGAPEHGLAPGDPVIVQLDVVCGTCRHCLAGNTQICTRLTRIGFERPGGHAQRVAVPARNAIKLPPGVPPEQAAIIPDAVGCMYHALAERAGVGPGQVVLLIGLGGLGMQGVQVARALGAVPLGTDRVVEKGEAARSLGLAEFWPAGPDLAGAVAAATAGALADATCDLVGTPESMRMALDCTRNGGTILSVGYTAPEFTLPFYPFLMREIQVVGVRGTNRRSIEACVDLVVRGQVRPLVGATYPLDRIEEALLELRRGHTIGRGVILPQS